MEEVGFEPTCVCMLGPLGADEVLIYLLRFKLSTPNLRESHQQLNSGASSHFVSQRPVILSGTPRRISVQEYVSSNRDPSRVRQDDRLSPQSESNRYLHVPKDAAFYPFVCCCRWAQIGCRSLENSLQQCRMRRPHESRERISLTRSAIELRARHRVVASFQLPVASIGKHRPSFLATGNSQLATSSMHPAGFEPATSGS